MENSAPGTAVGCPTGTKVHGAGGGGTLSDSDPVYLQSVIPAVNLTAVSATMTGVPSPGGMVAQATCAT